MSAGARSSTLFALVLLHADVVRARWRRAVTGPRDAAGVALGGLAAAASLGMLLIASLAFCFVGRTLISSLLSGGRADLAAGVAGLLADATLLVVILAVALTDPLRAGLDPRPLSILPLTRTELVVIDLVSLGLAHPAALVMWSAGLALYLGAAGFDERAGWSMLPAATGIVALGAAVALVARRLWLGSLSVSLGRPAQTALRGAIFAVPVIGLTWLGAAGAELSRDALFSPTPGGVVALALGLVSVSPALSVALGLLLHVAACAVVVLVARSSARPEVVALPRRRPRRGRWLPVEAARVWRPVRASGSLLQGSVAAALGLGITALVAPRAPSSWPVAETGVLLAVWMLVSSTAPLAANVLGHGGRAAASFGLLPELASRSLSRGQAWTFVPVAAVIAAGSLALWTAFENPRLGKIALAAGVGLLAATGGLGGLASVLWPWPAGMDHRGEPLWTPGPGRLLLSAGHGVVLALAAASLVPPQDPVPGLLRAAAAGLILGLGAWTLALRILPRRRAAILETLLR